MSTVDADRRALDALDAEVRRELYATDTNVRRELYTTDADVRRTLDAEVRRNP